MADDFVVQTKVDILRQSLGAVQQVLTATNQTLQKSTIDKLLDFPTEISALLGTIIKEAGLTREQLSTLMNELDPEDEFSSNISDLFDSVDRIDDAVRGLSQKVGACKGLASDLRKVGLRNLTVDRADIMDSIVTLASQLRTSLSANNYFDSRSSAEAVLGEFVELLLGAAARSNRFGHDDSMAVLFKIADALPALWPRVNGWEWRAITVPSFAERNEASEAGILRIGYPEWSVWALPLLHYQFGHVYLRRRTEYAGLAKAPGGVDALATVFAGPAYVLAALLFRIDPMAAGGVSTDATDGGPSDPPAHGLRSDPIRPADTSATLRSATMLRTLREIARADEQSTLGLLTERIIASWRAAITAANRQPDAFDAALEADGTKERVIDALQAAQAILPGSGALREPKLPHWATNWAIVQGWANELAKATGTPDLGRFKGDRPLDSIPLLLNATWLARIGVRPAEDAPPNSISGIAERATVCMLRVIDAGQRGPDRRGGGKNI